MNFKTKLFLITLFPIILISIAMMFVIDVQSNRLSASQAETVGDMFTKLKHAELKNYVTLARNALTPIYTSKLKTKRQAQREVTEIVRKMTSGEDNYFYIYDGDGKNIVNPRLTHLVGSNWIGLKDADGRRVVRDLIDRAKTGGEFYSYIWKKPSSGEYVEKLGYSVFLDRWDWMIGSGIYMDDVSQQVSTVLWELQDNIGETRLVMFILTLAGVALTALVIALARLSEQRLADARLKALTARLVDAQEEERKRVSRELHDSISQLLVSSRYGLESALGKSGEHGDIAEPIEKSMHALDGAIAEVRRISRALRPSVLDDMGLAAAVKALGKEFARQSNIEVEVEAEPARSLLTDEAKTALYRVIQEALTNVSKHSRAGKVSIRLFRRGSSVVLLLEDDGVGMPSGGKLTNTAGLGIRNMQERIDTFGGSIRFRRARSGGLAIHVTLPIEGSSFKRAA